LYVNGSKGSYRRSRPLEEELIENGLGSTISSKKRVAYRELKLWGKKNKGPGPICSTGPGITAKVRRGEKERGNDGTLRKGPKLE